MQLQSGQGGTNGPNASVEYVMRSALITIAGGGTLKTGQVVCRNQRVLSGQQSTSEGGAPAANLPASGGQCDEVVLPNATGAGDVYGVYQGPPIVNPSASVALTLITAFQCSGYALAGVLTTGTIDVGYQLAASTANAYANHVTTRAIGDSVGRVTATTVAGVLVTVGAVAVSLVNCDINGIL